MSAEEVNIADLPSLDFIRQLPSWVSVRVGVRENGSVILVFAEGEHQLHVEMLVTEGLQRDWRVAMMNLGAAVFDREHPGEFGRLIRAQVAAARDGAAMLPGDIALLARYNDLTALRPSDA